MRRGVARRGLARPWLIALLALWGAALLAGGALVARALLAPPAHESYFAEAQAREGVIAYSQHCASCHGVDLLGDVGPALAGERFRERWGGASVADLYEYVHDRMPPGRGGELPRETYAASVAYLLRRNGFPAGEHALVGGAERLAGLELRPELATGTAEDLAPSVTSRRRELLGSVLLGRGRAAGEGAGLREVAQTDPAGLQAEGADLEGDAVGAGAGGAQEGSGSGDAGQSQGNRQDQAQGGGQDSGQGGGDQSGAAPSGPGGTLDTAARALIEAQPLLAHVRLSVYPEEATVAVTGADGEPAGTLPGGSRLLAGLEPGSYTIAATLAGRVLEQTVVLRSGEIAEVTLLFGEAEVRADAEAPDDREAVHDEFLGVTLDGDALYEWNCMACHGPQGEGGIGLPLAGNDRLDDPAWVIRRVLAGGQGMPAFGGVLVDAEVAEVVTFIREAWGNDLGPVAPRQVAEVRAAIPATQLLRATGPDLQDAPIGQQRFTQMCSACHGLEGGGDIGPPLAGNPALRNEQLVVSTMLYGRGIMPAYNIYPDHVIAEIASYVRTAWGNGYGAISERQVAIYRPDVDAATDADDPGDPFDDTDPFDDIPLEDLDGEAADEDEPE